MSRMSGAYVVGSSDTPTDLAIVANEWYEFMASRTRLLFNY